MKTIPNQYRDLLKDETKAYMFLATTMADGSPQVTPVWFNMDEDFILVNTNEGRVKDKNMIARPRVALVIQDPKTPYRYIQIRGEIIGRTIQGADEHINALSLKYNGKPWPYDPKQKRVIYKIRPTSIDAH